MIKAISFRAAFLLMAALAPGFAVAEPPACKAPMQAAAALGAAPAHALGMMSAEHMMSLPLGQAGSVPLSELAEHDPMPPPDLKTGTLDRDIQATSEARKWFNQGLRLYYAFNHREAYRAFRYALSKDPNCVMCAWGAAMSLGVNINQLDQPEPDRVVAEAFLRQALQMPNPRPAERALVQALQRRFTAYATLPPDKQQERRNVDYGNAMTRLACDNPDDLDIQTLYVDAVMNILPWRYWNLDGSPRCEIAEGKKEPICGRILPAVATLELYLKDHPDHMGLVHWSIHLMEASTTPEKVTPYADTLAGLGQDSSHLQHMASHIYYRIGDHLRSVQANRTAYQTDQVYFSTVPLDHPEGDRFFYGYQRHNLHFMLASALMTGRLADISDASDALRKTEGKVLFRTDRYRGVWYQGATYYLPPDQLLKLEAPPADQPKIWGFARASWDYAQALGFIRLGDRGNALKALKALQEDGAAFRRDNPDQMSNGTVTRIMAGVAEARLKVLLGQAGPAVTQLVQTASLQGAIGYDEPPFWLVPVEQTLAAVFIGQGRNAEAVDALHWSLNHGNTGKNLYTNFVGNGWAYYGLKTAYEKMGRLTPDQQKDYDQAVARLKAYCPSDADCVFSLERM